MGGLADRPGHSTSEIVQPLDTTQPPVLMLCALLVRLHQAHPFVTLLARRIHWRCTERHAS